MSSSCRKLSAPARATTARVRSPLSFLPSVAYPRFLLRTRSRKTISRANVRRKNSRFYASVEGLRTDEWSPLWRVLSSGEEESVSVESAAFGEAQVSKQASMAKQTRNLEGKTKTQTSKASSSQSLINSLLACLP